MCIISVSFLDMKETEYESEAGSSQDLPPSANQPARDDPADEVVPGAVVEADLNMCEWMRTIARRLDILETPSTTPQTPRRQKRARVEEYDFPPTYER